MKFEMAKIEEPGRVKAFLSCVLMDIKQVDSAPPDRLPGRCVATGQD